MNIRSHGPDSVYVEWRGVSTGLFEETLRGYKVGTLKFEKSPAPSFSSEYSHIGYRGVAFLFFVDPMVAIR